MARKAHASLFINLTVEEHQRIKAQAQTEGMTLREYVLHALGEYQKARDWVLEAETRLSKIEQDINDLKQR